VAYGTITSYAWNFGDGNTATTSAPTTAYVYSTVGSYTATVTETDSAGTSTTQVFNGKTVSRNGGASAKTSRSVSIAPPPPVNTSVLMAPLAPNPPTSGDPPTSTSGAPPATPPTPAVISTTAVTVTARGDALIEVSCPATAGDGCRGTITIRIAEPRARRARALAARCGRGCRPLGSAKYEARAGQKTRVRVHIASYGRELLARRKAVRVTVTATNVSGGHTASVVRTITLKAHGRAK
jgi:PKD repeat protein